MVNFEIWDIGVAQVDGGKSYRRRKHTRPTRMSNV